MSKYLVKSTLTYRVDNEDEALALRETLREIECGELTDFGYKNKEVKSKGEVIDTYTMCSATITFNTEKEPENVIYVSFEDGDRF